MEGNKHILEFVIPRGLDGLDGIDGIDGELGPTGPTGPTGPAGTSVRILGSYDTYEDLIAEHPTGNVGDSYLVDEALYVWSENENRWQNVGVVRGPQGIQGIQGIQGETGIQGVEGPIGPTGPAGPERIRSGYFVTFSESFPENGFEIISGARIPIKRKEVDTTGLYVLDQNDNTIQFNKTGAYKVEFVVSAYVPYQNNTFNKTTDFISVGLRKVDETIIFAGASSWVYNESSVQLVAQGICIISDISEPIELVNLTKRSIYLDTPNIMNTITDSYFINAPVTLLIEYLG